MKSKGFEDLEVWQKSADLAEKIYHLTYQFPKEELYGMTSQMRRCSISIASNIAEGSARGSNKEFTRFTGIAIGSLAELKTQIIIAHRVNLIKHDSYQALLNDINQIGRMLKGLQRSLNEKPSTINHQLSTPEVA